MPVTPEIGHFQRDAARQDKVAIAIQVSVTNLEGHHVTLAPIEEGPNQAWVHRLDVSGLVNQWWRTSGTLDENGTYLVAEAKVEGAHENPDRVSRSSQRIERPEITCVGHHESWSVDFTVLDLSAGGVGLYSAEHIKVETGESIVLEMVIEREPYALEAFVAHVAPDAKGTRLGLQFVPMSATLAEDFYAALNDLAGETLIEEDSETSILTQFSRALEQGQVALEHEWHVDLQDESLILSGASPATVRDLARRLYVKTNAELWVAEIEPIGENTYDLRRLRTLQETQARGAGYRVSPQGSAPATISRGELGSITGHVADLSRGGVGVVLLAPTEFETRERVEVTLDIPGVYQATMLARVVFARFEPDGRQFVGLAFVGLNFDQTVEIDMAVSNLENREVLRSAMYFGIAVLAVFAVIVAVGTLI